MDSINFENRTEYEIPEWEHVQKWLNTLCELHDFKAGDISYLFCDDAHLLEVNKQYLDHDTLTDIITFDYTYGKTVSADILISLERVEDNATDFKVTYTQELSRVMAHGVLHCMGFKDKTEADQLLMREAEEKAIQLFDNQ
ncbi:rRNA maturation RNase YbeY [Gilvibacter sediminis]|uniref:rRNA maturation RNase YbeY n=1 Tax=Gilvibacter sediminis TaxID=379071 RepID=UPI0023501FDF|nr:rRNA maturation RNase YbeY [Gilvibacter sediminis]MDC7996814.1 rRNA maturation RNase YbeY [Gilvibacter sediminis]